MSMKRQRKHRLEKKIKITIHREQTVRYLFIKLLKYGIGVALAAYVLMVLMWLYAIEAPIAHVKEAFTGMSQFTTGIRRF